MVTANYDLPLQKGWKFHAGEVNRNTDLFPGVVQEYLKAGKAMEEWKLHEHEEEWEEVSVPHDWMAAMPVSKDSDYAAGYKERGIGWYEKLFVLPPTPIESARLVFEGVLGHCAVYVNGVIAARNFSGYNRFSCEIGDYLVPGAENTIILYVDARPRELWSYEGAGLYRPVSIEFREYCHFDKEKCFVRGQRSEDNWNVLADLVVSEVGKGNDADLKLCACLKDEQGNVLVKQEAALKEAKQQEKMILTLSTDVVRLWSPESPYLYTFECELLCQGRCIDKVQHMVGLRQIEWKADQGMYLNGKPYPVKGICCHQDHAGVGIAVHPEIMEYRIRRLKEAGVNAYRCAHHAPAKSLLEICDRLGMLVMVENRKFSLSQDVLQQLDALVYLARNHVSVFMYSLFNEETWQAEERGVRMVRRMRDRILALDDTRAVTGGQNAGYLTEHNTTDVLDVMGFNYSLGKYEDCHKRIPDKVILGTENCPTFATRGVYRSDKEKQVFACYGEEWPRAFSESLEETMECMYSKAYVGGNFVWAGFDHRGEVNPYQWPSVISHWGFHDYCGFPKDTAHLLAAWYKEELCVHLLPHWNWQPGEEVRVCAFTNADTAELYLNGKSLGRKNVEKRRAEWMVPFVQGKISVIAERDGLKVCDEVVTAGNPAKLQLTDETPENGSGRVHIINIAATDEADVFIPDFDGIVKLLVENGRILGVGNGNPNGHQPDIEDSIEMFHGRAQVIMEGECGKLTALCEGVTFSEIHW